MTIAEALIRLMKEEGLNNLSFAHLLGVNPPCISRYLSGSRIPPLKRLIQISFVCNRRLILEFNNNNPIHARFILRETVRETSFNEKLVQCQNPLMGYCISRLNLKKEDAEDVVQETLYRALTLHETWQREISMLTWLIGIAKNVKNRKASKLIFVENYLEHESMNDEVETVFRKSPNLFNYIEEMKKSSKQTYKLYLSGLPLKEIAIQLNTTEAAVKMRIKNVKKYLRIKLESETPCNSN